MLDNWLEDVKNIKQLKIAIRMVLRIMENKNDK